MSKLIYRATPLERRIARRLEARGERGLAEALLGLKDVAFGGRYRFESLYAVGGEGAVYLVRDQQDRNTPLRVAKVALLPHHKPFELDAHGIRKRRYGLRVEAQYLAGSVSTFLPRHIGTFEFQNPLLDPARGDAFAELEPVLVMEKLPGRDLDVWLARMHHQQMPLATMQRTLDRVAVVLLQALVDLYDRGFFYADLRPANLRMMGRPERRIRLLDAGSLVAIHDRSGRFPHVPAYLPPGAFQAHMAGELILPSADTQAVMAGRTLFEVATGTVPLPGMQVDFGLLPGSQVSPPVQEVVDGLCRGDFEHCRIALKYLARRATRRVARGNHPSRITQQKTDDLDDFDVDGSDSQDLDAAFGGFGSSRAAQDPAPAARPAPPAQRTRLAEPVPSAPAPAAPAPPQRKTGLFAKLRSLFRR